MMPQCGGGCNRAAGPATPWASRFVDNVAVEGDIRAVLADEIKVDRTLDIRGEVCPLTFVRSKLAIEKMAVGEVLEIIVDHPPAAVNVPRSMEREGQTVLKLERAGDAEWRLFVRKDREKAKI